MIGIETGINAVSFKNNSSVQHIRTTSLAASSEAVQQYAFVLFDLASTLLLQHFKKDSNVYELFLRPLQSFKMNM